MGGWVGDTGVHPQSGGAGHSRAAACTARQGATASYGPGPAPLRPAPGPPPAHLPSALALGEKSLADSVRFRKDTPLPMWLCCVLWRGWGAGFGGEGAVEEGHAIAPWLCGCTWIYEVERAVGRAVERRQAHARSRCHTVAIVSLYSWI